MDSQTFGIIQKSDINALGVQLALQCAPFIAGLKPSNLFISGGDDLGKAVGLFEYAGFSYFILLKTNSKIVFLIYDPKRLEECVLERSAVALLRKTGYYALGLGELLKNCRLRYRQYASEGREFPHELGIFLGYPVEDVEGFIKNSGKNCLYAGYWKVYADLPKKLSVFKSYDRARLSLLKMLSAGKNIREIVGHGCV